MRRGPKWPVRSLLEAGADLRTIQVLLGHRKIERTTVYLHLSRKHLMAVANPLDTIEVSSPERVKPGISIIDSGPTDNIRLTVPECNGQSGFRRSAPVGIPGGSKPARRADVLARELNHSSRGCLGGQAACRASQDAKAALRACALCKRREIFDWIDGLAGALIQAWAAHAQRQAETAQRLAAETWLQRNGVNAVTQNKKVLLVFLEQFAHN